jgi:hypothetical protein
MMNIMLRSTSSSGEKALIPLPPVQEVQSRDTGCLHRVHGRGSRLWIVDQHFEHIDGVVLAEVALRFGERHEHHRAVILGHAHFEDRRHLVGLNAGRRTERGRRPARRHQRHHVADPDLQRLC